MPNRFQSYLVNIHKALLTSIFLHGVVLENFVTAGVKCNDLEPPSPNCCKDEMN